MDSVPSREHSRYVPIEDQIKAADREVALRRNVYAKRVEAGKMTPGEARAELDAMLAIGRSLRSLATAERLAVELLTALGYDTAASGGSGEPAGEAPSPSPESADGAHDGPSPAELCAERLELVETADLDTLRQWFVQARDAWPEPQRTEMMTATMAEAEGRDAN